MRGHVQGLFKALFQQLNWKD